MPRLHILVLAVFLVTAIGADAKEGGWRPLFDGTDLAGWTSAAGQQPGKGWGVEDGTLVRREPAGDLWTRDRFGDFVLDLEFQTTGNSGVFIRTDKPTDNVQTGLEVQIEPPASAPGKHSCGALYDALAPTREASKKDGWNHLVITARGAKITVVMNDEPIIDADLDRWTEAGKNPDGTNNKFHTALKDFKREGHIGLQDHGAVVKFRNIKIKPLDSEGGK
jgi:3-keto-disaccharide hydrolase